MLDNNHAFLPVNYLNMHQGLQAYENNYTPNPSIMSLERFIKTICNYKNGMNITYNPTLAEHASFGNPNKIILPPDWNFLLNNYSNPFDACHLTAQLCLREKESFTPETFRQVAQIRSVTGSALKRLYSAMFQDDYLTSENIVILELNQLGMPWICKNSSYWSEDIISLYAIRNRITYNQATEAIWRHLDANESKNDLKLDDKKAYRTIELEPLNRQILAPWGMNVFFRLFGAEIYCYYNKSNVLVGCSCTMSFGIHGSSTLFYTLCRSPENPELWWLPKFPPAGSNLFFKGNIGISNCSNVIFAIDEKNACDMYNPKGFFDTDCPLLACPGGIENIINYDISIAKNKSVSVYLTDALAQDDSFIKKLASKVSEAGAKHLSINSTSCSLRSVDLNYGSESIAISTNQGITMAGEMIPGADIKRKSILSPIIESGQLVWIFGPEKSGKSWFVRNLAHVISYGGSFLGKYQAEKCIKVLFIDSEMPADKLENNALLELKGLGYTDGVKFSRKVARASDNPTGEINLLEEEWQQYFDKILSDYDVIILDCYYGLTRSSVMPKGLLAWITPWKNKGKTFIVVDHTNKDKELQGGMDKRRAADLFIEICPNKKQEIEISFPRARYLSAENAQSFTLLKIFEKDSSGKLDKFYFKLVEETPVTPSLSDELCLKVLAYVCKENHAMHAKDEIASLFARSDSTIYEYIKLVKDVIVGTSKVKDMDVEGIKSQVKIYQSLTKDKLLNELERLKKE